MLLHGCFDDVCTWMNFVSDVLLKFWVCVVSQNVVLFSSLWFPDKITWMSQVRQERRSLRFIYLKVTCLICIIHPK